MFSEHMGSTGDINDPTYSEPIVKRWNQKVKEGDAYLVGRPEYNHSVPSVLKNAIDSVFVSFAFATSRWPPSATAAGSERGLGRSSTWPRSPRRQRRCPCERAS